MSGIIYWKLRSQLAFNTVVFDGHFASVGEVKNLIADKMALGSDAGNQLVLSHPTTATEYREDTEQLPRGTSVLVRRVPPGQQRLQPLLGATHAAHAPAAQAPAGQQAAATAAEAQQHDEFGADPFTQAAADAKRAQEEAAARAKETAAASAAAASAAAAGQGGRGGRGGMAGRGRGRGKVPPHATYICPRCNRVGQHWVNDCPTRDDASFDVRAVRAPAGIPMGKMMNNPDGSILLPSGALGQLAMNSAAYEAHVAQMMGMPAPAEPAPLAIEASKPAEEPQPVASQQQTAQQQHAETAAPSPLGPTPQQAAPSSASPAPASPAPQLRQPLGQPATGALLDDDDDIFNAAARPIQLADAVPTNSGAGTRGPAPNQVTSTEDEEAARLRAEREQIPADLRRPFCTPKEFLDYLPLLSEMLPSASSRLLLKAFAQGVPLTPTEFQHLKDQEAQAQQPAEQPKAAGRSSRAEEERSRRSKRRSRSRSRTRSKSRERARDQERERSRRSRRQESPPRAAASEQKAAPSGSQREVSVKRGDSLRKRASTQQEEPKPAPAAAPTEAPATKSSEGGVAGVDSGDDANGHAVLRALEESSRVVDAEDPAAATGSQATASKEASADDRSRPAGEGTQPSDDGVSGSDDDGSSEGGDAGSSGVAPKGDKEHRSHRRRRSGEDGDRSKKDKKHKKHRKHKDRDREKHKKEKSSRRSRSKESDGDREGKEDKRREKPERRERDRPTNAGGRLFQVSIKAAQDVDYAARVAERKRRFGEEGGRAGGGSGVQQGADRWGHDMYEDSGSRGYKRR